MLGTPALVKCLSSLLYLTISCVSKLIVGSETPKTKMKFAIWWTRYNNYDYNIKTKAQSRLCSYCCAFYYYVMNRYLTIIVYLLIKSIKSSVVLPRLYSLATLPFLNKIYRRKKYALKNMVKTTCKQP